VLFLHVQKVQVKGRLIVCGFRSGIIQTDVADKISYIIGDHNGMTGAVDTDGLVYLAEVVDDDEDSDVNSPTESPAITPQTGGSTTVDYHNTSSCLRLVPVTQREDLQLLKVSVAGNFRVMVTYKPKATDTEILVTSFRDLGHWKEWYCFRPSSATPAHLLPLANYHIPGKFKQLCTGNAHFTCLNWEGQVYTWGDARFGGLGRDITADNPADQPGLLTCFDEGEKIDWIGGGGNLFSAMNMDGTVYVFSGVNARSSSVAERNQLEMHHDTEPGEKVMVAIEDENRDPVEFDLMAVGNGHVLLRGKKDGKVYGAGENRNGQLGIGDSRPFVPEWVEVVPKGCQAMRAGSKTSLVRVDVGVNVRSMM